jgi:NAD(P)H-hydrate epimerase
MVQADSSKKFITEIPDSEKYNAIGVGPGLGTEQGTAKALKKFLETCKKPMVLDADALNILSMNKDWLSLLAPRTILTPHTKEFERLAGKCEGGFQRLMKQIEFSQKYKCVVVLKGAYTSVSDPDGSMWFNSTGNPGMASGGSGDVLTGMILSLLAQRYHPHDAAIVGVYLHGLAGDIAAEESSMESLLASDIIKSTGKAFNRIRDLGKVNFNHS